MKSPWPRGLYVLLDPETDKPEGHCGEYALQSDSLVICDTLKLEEAQYISRAVNSHQALVEALENLLENATFDAGPGGEWPLDKATTEAKDKAYEALKLAKA